MGSKRYLNPNHRFFNAQVPNWLMRRKEVSQGAKLCYGRLCEYLGYNTKCWPSIESLAYDLGTSDRQVKRYMDELISLELVERQRVGLGQTNRYYFPEHPWMFESPEDQRSYMSQVDGPYMSPPARPDTSPELSHRIISGDTYVSPGLASDQSLVSSKQADFKLDARSLPDDISEVIEAWEGQLSLPRVRTFAGKRAGSIRRALKDPFWREHWRDALSKLIKTPLLMGKGKISWRADLDWFLEPRNIEKLINGVYDDPNQKPPTRDYTRETI